MERAEEGKVATLPFKMPGRKFAGMLLRRKGVVPLMAGGMLAAAAVVAGIAMGDMRFYIVALMILLIVMPLTLALVYISAGLRPECFCNVRMHIVAVTDAGVDVFMPEEKVKESEEAEDEIVYKPHSCHWDGVCCRDLQMTGNEAWLRLRGESVDGFLWIDCHAFGSSEDESRFFARLKGLCHK